MMITAIDLIDQIDSNCREIPLQNVEIKFKLIGIVGSGLFFTLRKKRKPKDGLTHDLVIYNRTN